MVSNNTDYKYKNSKYTIDEELRIKILKYLYESKKVISNDLENEKVKNKIITGGDELLNIFKYNENKFYFWDSKNLIEKVNKTKFFGTDNFIQKAKYIAGRLIVLEFSFDPDNEAGDRLITYINSYKDSQWYIDDQFQCHIKSSFKKDMDEEEKDVIDEENDMLDEKNDIVIQQDYRMRNKQIDDLYDNDIINEEKLAEYILGRDIIKTKNFTTKEEILEMITMAKENKTEGLKKLDIMLN